MSAFFDFGKPKMIDVKKRLGLAEGIEETAVDTGSTSNYPDSWTELAPSRGSLCSSVDANMFIIDDAHKDSRSSPVSILQSPHTEFENLEQVKYKLVRDMLPPGKNTDWIWDWSSRPEALPPKSVRMRQYGSNLTTPPNSPEPELLAAYPFDCEPTRLLSMNVVFGFLVSNLVTFVIGAAIGFVACKRWARSREL